MYVELSHSFLLIAGMQLLSLNSSDRLYLQSLDFKITEHIYLGILYCHSYLGRVSFRTQCYMFSWYNSTYPSQAAASQTVHEATKADLGHQAALLQVFQVLSGKDVMTLQDKQHPAIHAAFWPQPLRPLCSPGAARAAQQGLPDWRQHS